MQLTSGFDASQGRNYPLNCWWVAAFSDELGRNFLPRWLLDMPILLYRKEDGTPVALEDRCPHRSAPLSIGTRSGDNVACGYHGFEFAPSGQCVRVPSQPSPGPIAVRAYPVREVGPFIWIYTGDLARIDDVPPPTVFDWATSEDFVLCKGRQHIQANYMLLKENVLDLTHFGYVHAKSLQVKDWVNPPKVSVEGDQVTYRQVFEDSPLAPFYTVPMGLPPGTPMDRVNAGTCLTPAIHQGGVDFVHRRASPGERQRYTFRICHATTPIDATSMHYWWVSGRDYGRYEGASEEAAAGLDAAFQEDRLVIEAIQRLTDRDPRPTESIEKSVTADAPGIQARRALSRWMQRE